MKIEANGRKVDTSDMAHMCFEKCRYPTRQIAKRYLKKANAQRAARGEPPMHIYKCPLCLNYHFTSQQNRRSRG